jgi:hypothetical protein
MSMASEEPLRQKSPPKTHNSPRYCLYMYSMSGHAVACGSVVDPHLSHADADPDSTTHPDADPDSDFYLMRIQMQIQIFI